MASDDDATLARRMFGWGFLGLPLLWFVCFLNFRPKLLDGTASPELRTCEPPHLAPPVEPVARPPATPGPFLTFSVWR